MRRDGFTLIELLVIVAILATMVTIGVGSLASGQGMARVRGATRDVYAAIRHARSVALVTGQRVVVNYSNETIDDEPAVKIEVFAAKIMSADGDRPVAQPYYVMDYKELPQKEKAQRGDKYELVHIRKPGEGDGEDGEKAKAEGESLEEVLFSPMSDSVVKGMRILVKKGDEVLTDETAEQTRSRISVFSNVDYLLNRYKESKAESTKEGDQAASSSAPKDSGKDSTSSSGSVNDMDETVSVVWETNGAVEPHRVWIYPDGKKPEDGLQLNIDSFGAVKVLGGGEKEDD